MSEDKKDSYPAQMTWTSDKTLWDSAATVAAHLPAQVHWPIHPTLGTDPVPVQQYTSIMVKKAGNGYAIVEDMGDDDYEVLFVFEDFYVMMDKLRELFGEPEPSTK